MILLFGAKKECFCLILLIITTDAELRIGNIHLADNTRKEPGSGDIDYKAAFAALKKMGYKGYMAMECGLTAPADSALPKSVKFLHKCIG